MHKIARTILKPAFSAMAKAPIMNPHAYNEQALMAAGAKPCIIGLAEDSISPSLQNAIDEKKVVHINDFIGIDRYRIYYHPETVTEATNAAKIDKQWKVAGSPEEDKPDDRNFPVVPMHSQGWGKHFQSFLQGHEKEFCVQIYTNNDLANPDDVRRFDQAVENGILAKIDYESHRVIQTYAQANKVAEGHELFARYYGPLVNAGNGYFAKPEDDYPILPLREEQFRTAELLGYSPDDAKLFCRDGIYNNENVRSTLIQTAPARRWFRHHALMMEAQDRAEKPEARIS